MADARRLFALHDASARSGIPVEELLGQALAAEGDEREVSRRELLAGAAVLATGAALAHPLAAFARKPVKAADPRIAIVGGGLAGLRCAHALWTRGGRHPVSATVYEAHPERLGGRCWSLRGYFGGGLVTEHGGAFINTEQHAVRRLAKKLGLSEEVCNGGALRKGEQVALLGGHIYSEADMNADWASVGFETFTAALKEAHTSSGAARLDGISVTEWLAETEIGTSSRLGRLMLANAVSENGGDPDDQSSLDLIELLFEETRPTRKRLQYISGSDERFHIVGGNDQIVSRMVEQLPPQAIELGQKLIALRAEADGSSSLVFETDGGLREVTADIVVLALPFTTLREADLSASGLSAKKLEAIATFGMGTNGKIHLELAHKTWPGLGYNGISYGDWKGFCTGWDDTVPLGPDASPALYLGFPGGRAGVSRLTGEAHGPAPSGDVSWLLEQLEPIYPGTTAAFTGRAYEDHWASDPFVHGAYSYLRVGQATSYLQLAAKTEGPIHFAGEHTSEENEGFLDGGVETGERAAAEILRRL